MADFVTKVLAEARITLALMKNRGDNGEVINAADLASMRYLLRCVDTMIDTAITDEHATPAIKTICDDARREFIELSHAVCDAARSNALQRGVIPFGGVAGGEYSILSIIHGPHSIGEGIFAYLNMIDANNLRCICEEFKQAVSDFPWMDASGTMIKGSLEVWRRIFPYARTVDVSTREDLVDADFIHIRGDARARLHTVYMALGHGQVSQVTDAAFVHLR